eukprot:1589462-Ditylum_brightwellii.AAC.1
MPGFQPPPEIGPWDKLNPTHVPIPMCIVKCKHNCCAVKCCPLILAWASTIHRFQGFEAGPGPHDTVKHLLVDPGPGTTKAQITLPLCTGLAQICVETA